MAASLRARIQTALIGLALLAVVIGVGAPLLFPTLFLLVWLGSDELGAMLKRRGIALNPWLVKGWGFFVLLASLPQLGPGPWREMAVGLGLLFAFFYELLFGANVPRLVASVFALLYLPWTLGYALMLRYTPDGAWGLWSLALPLLAAFANDIGAFFVGKRWGRIKIAPEISPNKTLEGSIGGFVSAFLALLIFSGGVHSRVQLSWLDVLGLSLLIALAAQVGDLAESMLKRYAGVKDSGTLLPGHGGLLDRLDSVLLTLPLTYYLVVMLP